MLYSIKYGDDHGSLKWCFFQSFAMINSIVHGIISTLRNVSIKKYVYGKKCVRLISSWHMI